MLLDRHGLAGEDRLLNLKAVRLKKPQVGRYLVASLE
jgi:hypothetical protein